MDIARRNNVQVSGLGSATIVFAHGFGCDQKMWRVMAPEFARRYRVVTFDHVGCGASDLGAYTRDRYSTLAGYADDLVQVIQEFGAGRVVVVGHSVSAMIAMLAGLNSPGAISAHVMIGPSPCYINDGDYVGGFSRGDIDGLLDLLESDYLGWAADMAPVIMGTPQRPELALELAESICRMDPGIAKQFARITFLSDSRADLPRLREPTLIIQSTEDRLVPLTVGEFMHRVLPHATLKLVKNLGHCPHLSAPSASADAMNRFMASIRMQPPDQ